MKVLIAADTRLHAEGLALVLGRQATPLSVAMSQYGEAVMLAQRMAPDIVLVEAGVPEAVDTVRALHAVLPAVRIVVLSVPEAEVPVIAYAEAGATAFLTREADIPELLATITAVDQGECPCSPRISAILLRHIATRAARRPQVPSLPGLTHRERQIVELIDRGLTNREIGRELFIEVPTVKNHIHNILEKLQVRRRYEAAALLRQSQAPPRVAPPSAGHMP